MPVTPTYPGVYVEELPSGVRTIVGVATSITAFIGFADRGLTNDPIRIKNFGSYERLFGGLSLRSTMSYAVQQYFLNGGSDAIIVRLSNQGWRASVELEAEGGTLTLEALEIGDDGNKLKVTVADNGTENFNLTITPETGSPEIFTNIAIGDLQETLSNTDSGSKLVRIKPKTVVPSGRPNAVANKEFEGGFDLANVAQYSLPVATEGQPVATPTPADGEAEAQALILEAASEGRWGNNLQISVDYDTKPGDFFNLTVVYRENGQDIAQETLRNLSMDEDDNRFVTEVLEDQSSLVRIKSLPDNNQRPSVTNNPITVDTSNEGSNGGTVPDDRFHAGSENDKTGIYALEKADLFNILCIPPVSRKSEITDRTWTPAAEYCDRRRAMLIVDPPSDWATKDLAVKGIDAIRKAVGDYKKNAAIFFPRVKLGDPLKENRSETFVPCGIAAGIFARTDANRGVWKAPAGTEATLTGVRELTVKLTDPENGDLNPLGINCLRTFRVYGNVVWGSRTLDGADPLASEWKYIPVRRLALFLEESLYRGTQWVVFEPNDEPLWAQIRLNVGAFMNNLFKQGAFQGASARDAYFVKCDSETTTQNDIDRGIVNIIIGYAPLKPAEFVILKFQQIAGQLET